MKFSDAILLGHGLKKFDSTQWLSDDGSCGCAIGGAILAVGLAQRFIREAQHHSMSSVLSAYHVECFREQWPWIEPRHVAHISLMAHDVELSALTIEELVEWVRSVEPAGDLGVPAGQPLEAVLA